MSRPPEQRRAFLKRVVAAGAAAATPSLLVPADGGAQASMIGRLDHVAVPMQNEQAMIAFYRALGFTVRETRQIVSVHFADQRINFHRPALWRSGTFTLRAQGAMPPCGDFCWVWEGTREALLEALAGAGAETVAEGERAGGRDGGDAMGQSVYTRDPDGNLLEFLRYA